MIDVHEAEITERDIATELIDEDLGESEPPAGSWAATIRR
jgi:hypothetical protein